MLLFQICIPFAIEHFKLRATIKAFLRQWFTAVGWTLGLTNFLLARPEGTGGLEAGNVEGNDRLHDVARMAAEDQNRDMPITGDADATEESDDEEQAGSDYGFILRIVLLLILAWMTLFLFNSAVIVVPISLGRALFNTIPLLPITHGIKCNDLYAFVIGSYAIWAIIAATRYCIEHIKTRRAGILLRRIWKWSAIILKSSALLAIWVFVIPVLIGLLFELLVIVPVRVPLDESPVFLLYQDWALGLIFLKIWTRLVMLDDVTLLADESWRRKFERVRDDGFSRLRGLWVLQEIVIPIMMKLLTALCVPCVFARGVFPVLGYSLIVNFAVYRFAWVGCLSFSSLYLCAKRFHVWFRNLHNTIRDDRYLIGRRLHNFGEDEAKKSNEAEIIPEKEDPQDDFIIGHEQQADVGMRVRPHNLQNPPQLY